MPLHVSIPIQNTMEPIQGTQISPLISKCFVKVCYVGQETNRNGTVITKEVATEMAKTLPGCPIVGYFNEQDQDFEGHNRELVVKDGKFDLVDMTKPYGFVPTNANIGFEKYKEGDVEREYLVSDCYLWTGAYPEANRVVEKGNNQSMELTQDTGFWANDNKSNKRIFIYNEALIEKLCILGENVEPCFEGSQIRAFSLNTESQEFKDFKANMYSMITELQQTLEKGGSQPMNDNNNNPQAQIQEQNPNPDFKKQEPNGDPQKEKENQNQPQGEGGEKNDKGNNTEEEKKKKYNLEEIPEYQDLLSKYNAIASQLATLQNEKTSLETEVNNLRAYKLNADRKEKQAMIDSFYMLNDEDKKDVVDNIDTYSLSDIEAKLAITCVHKKVNFSANNQTQEQDQNTPSGMFNLQGGNDNSQNNIPAWIKAVQNNQ